MALVRDLNNFLFKIVFVFLFGCSQSSTSHDDETNLNYKTAIELECENYWVESHIILKPYTRIYTVYNNSGLITKFSTSQLGFQRGTITSFKPTCDKLLRVRNKWGDFGLVMSDGTLFGRKYFPGEPPIVKNNVGIYFGSYKRVLSLNPKHKHRNELGKQGLMDKFGKILLEPEYSLLSFYDNNKLIAEIEGERFIVDYKGQRQK